MVTIDSYINYENQIALLQRAMKISSDELFVIKKLRRESESLKGVNENLADILNSMNLNVVQLSVENNFNPIEYLKGKR
jgi:diketogulonate reductase-like aldo/keto reductase